MNYVNIISIKIIQQSESIKSAHSSKIDMYAGMYGHSFCKKNDANHLTP
jgi:hypothetical protein